MTETIPTISDITDAPLAARLHSAIDNKTKPLGALGRLEALALRIGSILGTENPVLEAPQMLVCAGDHGLAARGVSAFPGDVTWQMVENFLAGGAAVSVLARQHGLALTVVDGGVRRDFAAAPGPADRAGSPRAAADACTGPAMTAAAVLHRPSPTGATWCVRCRAMRCCLVRWASATARLRALLLSRLGGLGIDVCIGVGTGLDDGWAGAQARGAAAGACVARGCDGAAGRAGGLGRFRDRHAGRRGAAGGARSGG